MTIKEAPPGLLPNPYDKGYTLIEPVVKAEVVVSSSEQLRAGIKADIKTLKDQKKPLKVILDLSEIEFIAPMGIRALIAEQNELKKNKGEIVLANVPKRVAGALDFMGVVQNFKTITLGTPKT